MEQQPIKMTFLKPDIHDTIGIAAFASIGLMLLLLLVVSGVALSGIEPADWFKPAALFLCFMLPAVFAACVLASEAIR